MTQSQLRAKLRAARMVIVVREAESVGRAWKMLVARVKPLKWMPMLRPLQREGIRSRAKGSAPVRRVLSPMRRSRRVSGHMMVDVETLAMVRPMTAAAVPLVMVRRLPVLVATMASGRARQASRKKKRASIHVVFCAGNWTWRMLETAGLEKLRLSPPPKPSTKMSASWNLNELSVCRLNGLVEGGGVGG